MIIARLLRSATIAAGAIAASAGLGAAPASAQLNWDWGGGGMVGGSGRENVRFSPQFKKGEIIVSFGDRRLYFITGPGQAISYPIAVPREESRWAGTTSVTDKRVNPSWTPTPTMMAENPRLPRWVPGGHPMNPLGVRALYLGSSTYRIHGTDAPWTIGTAVSKGCIRMYNQDVQDLYPRATVGSKVTVTYNRFDGVATSSGGAGSNGNGGNGSSGGIFNFFGNDDPPPEKPRLRPMRAKSAASQ
jgi:lipoprotein-anchoring transpeptidase ErfK/SrfK